MEWVLLCTIALFLEAVFWSLQLLFGLLDFEFWYVGLPLLVLLSVVGVCVDWDDAVGLRGKKEVLNSLRGAVWTGPRGDQHHRSRRRRRHNGHHRITTASAAITTTVTTITTIIFIALDSGADGCW